MTSFAERFSAILEARTGIRLNRNNVLRVGGVLRARAETLGHPSPDAYVDSIEKNVATTEMQTLVNLVTVGKTSFYRYPEMVSAIVNVLVPSLHAQLHPARGLNIWSAGCSTGEEPYTLAMALTEDGWFAKRRIKILATDINTNALDTARAGRYAHTRIERLPQNIRRYVNVEGHALTVKDEIRERIGFDRLNLSADPFPDPGSWHIIICANVLIYFSGQGVARILDKFCNAMSPDAALFLGGAENPATYDRRLSPARFGKAYGFLYGPWNAEMTKHRLESQGPAPAKFTNEKTPATGIKKPVAPAPVAKVSDVSPRKRSTPITEELDATSFEVEKLLTAASGGARAMAIGRLTELHEQFPDHPRVSRSLGMLLFNEKRFEESCAALDDAIAADPLAFDLYFYAGWIYLALNDIDSARTALRRALFLEPGFTFARYELALTLHRAGQYEEAVREYARAEQAASDPRVNQRLRERAEGSSETFWINDSFIVELCRSNKERARQRLTPQTSGRIMGR